MGERTLYPSLKLFRVRCGSIDATLKHPRRQLVCLHAMQGRHLNNTVDHVVVRARLQLDVGQGLDDLAPRRLKILLLDQYRAGIKVRSCKRRSEVARIASDDHVIIGERSCRELIIASRSQSDVDGVNGRIAAIREAPHIRVRQALVEQQLHSSASAFCLR